MLSLFINNPRVGSSRLTQIFKNAGLKTYNEPFGRSQGRWGGDLETIKKYSNFNESDLKNNKDPSKEAHTIDEVLKSYSKSPEKFLIGIDVSVLMNTNISFIKKICTKYPCFFLQRKLIDSYISGLKVKITQDFNSSTNTTEIKPNADSYQFANHLKKSIFFYNVCYLAAIKSHGNVTVLNYEEWGDIPNQYQEEMLKNFLIKSEHKFLYLPSEDINPICPEDFVNFRKEKNTHFKQDNNKFWEDKIANSKKFIFDCKRLDIDEWFSESPINPNTLSLINLIGNDDKSKYDDLIAM